MQHLPWRQWRHVTKVDPDKPLPDRAIKAIFASGTDAIVIGGTQNVSRDVVVDLLETLCGHGIPCLVEVSAPACMVHGADGYLIPVVLNTSDPLWLVGFHQAAIRWSPDVLPWDLALTEGYIVCNEEAAVAELTRANIPETIADLEAWVVCAEQVLGLPLIYVEFSGRLADIRWIKAARRVMTSAHLVYGGGIRDGAAAARFAAIADTIVVGNVVHDDWSRLRETVEAVHATPAPSWQVSS